MRNALVDLQLVGKRTVQGDMEVTRSLTNPTTVAASSTIPENMVLDLLYDSCKSTLLYFRM